MTSYALDLETLSASELIEWAISEFANRFAIVASFQRGGMVLLDMAARITSSVRVITLDTGRLPPETFAMIDLVERRYGVRIEILKPDPAETLAMVDKFGMDLFRESVAHRRLCCQVRKVRPFERALAGLDAFAVGLRRHQGETRESVPKAEQTDGRWKLSPLADWTGEQLLDYISRNDVPQHPLYAQGYTSIGCGPCTRATRPGEGERAGRWWWEDGAATECGMHFTPDGKVERTVDVLLREILSD
jgi:phosphoadenosine phosphosulfate reductase